MRHKVDWHKQHVTVGQTVPVYPLQDKVKPFIGIVEKITKNRYKRISYVISGRNVFAEELFPAENQPKLRIKYHQWKKSI